MPGKHRCLCFSNGSSSFLYDLRRETPSTDRVLKERLLNVLSRAAAKKSRNPQRLWAEMPLWWTEVTNLKWKNPREHPKDNKDTLNQKIEILEQQLKQRDLMTKEVEAELQANKEGKRFDLELKSDFEAVIAKASGLHYMVNKVKEKMGSSRVISNRLADYIRGVKACMEKCLHSIDHMFQQVEEREIKKSMLWKKMGVEKQEGPSEDAIKRPWSGMYVNLESNNLLMDLEETLLEEPHFLSHAAPRTPSPPSPQSPPPPGLSFLSQSPHPVLSPQEGLVARHVLPDLSPFGRRASEIAVTKSSQTESDLQRRKYPAIPILPTRVSSAKKSRRQSTDDANEPVTVKQRVVSPPTFLKTPIEQRRHTPKSGGLEEDESAATTNVSYSYLLQDVCMPVADVSVLSGSTEQLDLSTIMDYGADFPLSAESTFEESDMKAMDSLAEQAKALSFDDLRPSVMEHINIRLPSRSLSDSMTVHSVPPMYMYSPSTVFSCSSSYYASAPATPAPAATAIKKEKPTESLSVAIANFLN